MNDTLLDGVRPPTTARSAPSYEQNQPYPEEPQETVARPWGSVSGSRSSRRRQYLSVAMAGISVLTMGGLCFGFDSLYPILYASGAFEGVCAVSDACATRPAALRSEKCCGAQVRSFSACNTRLHTVSAPAPPGRQTWSQT